MDTTYARRADGKIIFAEQGIDKSLSFYCPGCKHEVYAATEGKVQIPHFRHKSINGSSGCSEPESYVHWVTKELFAEEYLKTNTFYLSLGTTEECVHDSSCTRDTQHKINLKEKYPHIKVEKGHNGFRPDCLLYNDNGESIYFEVCYTSEVSVEKVNSGIPIIEASVYDHKSINKILKYGGFTDEPQSITKKENYYKAKLHNCSQLLPKEEISFDCEKKCIKPKNLASIPMGVHVGTRIGYRQYEIRHKPTFAQKGIDRLKVVSNHNEEAISYLSSVTGRKSKYHKGTEIPYIVGRSLALYNEGYVAYKDRIPSDMSVHILMKQESFLFICYDRIFVGAIRYESKWHLFTMSLKDNKEEIYYFDSVSDKGDLDKVIIQKFDIF